MYYIITVHPMQIEELTKQLKEMQNATASSLEEAKLTLNGQIIALW